MQDEYVQGLESEISKNKEHIQNVENFLFNDCIRVEITQDLKLLIFELSINNEAPFHNKKNNVGDAAILLSSVEYLKNNITFFGNSAFFISNNTEEYTDGVNPKSFHPQIKKLFDSLNINFERVLPAALNISKRIIEEIEQFMVQLADYAVEQFTWDIDKKENGTLMFLDIKYLNERRQKNDYLSLCVAKDIEKDKPRFISIILPEYINKDNGVFLFFVNNKIDEEKKELKFDTDDKFSVRIPFEDISNETCTARIWNGCAKDEEKNTNINVFEKFLEFDHIFFMYFNNDMSTQTISMPLFSFKQQYSLIP